MRQGSFWKDWDYQLKKIDCCEKGCILYWCDDATLENCDFCMRVRYKDSPSKKCVAKKYMFYFLLKNRLKRLYASDTTMNYMRWHLGHGHGLFGEMCHPCDSKAWKHFYTVHPKFASDGHNVCLGLCTDGFQLFHQSGSQYSCWPVILSPYNLPPGICMKDEYMFLTSIIPGKSQNKGLMCTCNH